MPSLSRVLPLLALALAFLASLLAPPALAAPEGVVTRTVDYTDADLDLRGYFARPENADDAPGVIVVHAWRGHSDYARRRAEMLAGMGYTAFALDMYGADVYAKNSEEASRRASKFYDDRDLLRRRFKAGYETMLSQEGVDASRTAAIGYCFGGTVVLEMARTGASVGVELDAVASFHGGLEFEQAPEQGEVVASVLVCNGQADPLVPYEQRKAFMEQMEEAGADFVFIEYAGAEHSFTDPSAGEGGLDSPVAYDQTADERSWAHMRVHFEQTLGPSGQAAGEEEDLPPSALDLARSYMGTLDDGTSTLSGVTGRLSALRSMPRIAAMREDIATLASELRSLSPQTRSLLADTFGEEIAARTDAFLGEVERLTGRAGLNDRLGDLLTDIPLWRPSQDPVETR